MHFIIGTVNNKGVSYGVLFLFFLPYCKSKQQLINFQTASEMISGSIIVPGYFGEKKVELSTNALFLVSKRNISNQKYQLSDKLDYIVLFLVTASTMSWLSGMQGENGYFIWINLI